MAALDDYLDRLGRELQASPEETAEVLREVRSHVELAVHDMARNGDDRAAYQNGVAILNQVHTNLWAAPDTNTGRRKIQATTFTPA